MVIAIIAAFALPVGAAAEAPPETPLTVTVEASYGHFFGCSQCHPGFTLISISTELGWRQTVTVSAHGKIVRPAEPDEGMFFEVVAYDWSCKRPGTIYYYVVKARGPMGQTETKRGQFKGASRWWCAKGWKHASEAAIKRFEHQSEEEERRQRAKDEAHGREVEHYETNCRAIGGIPVEIQTSTGPRVVCHSHTGGIIPVPT